MNRLIVKLDFHIARRTVALTGWYVKTCGKEDLTYTLEQAVNKGILRRVHSTYNVDKTHWDEYYEVVNPDITLIRARVSNRGNITAIKFPPEALKAPDEEVETIDLIISREEEGKE